MKPEMPPTRQTPILIALGIGFSWFFASAASVLLTFAIVDATFLGGVGHYSVRGTPVSPTQFLVTGGPVFLASTAMVVSIAWGLHRRRRWSRYVVLAFWALLGVISLAGVGSRSEGAEAAIVLVPFLGFTWWYLFRKAGVLTYFDQAPSTESPEGSRVRPVGVTLLAIALACLSVAGFANAAVYLGGVRLATMSPALAIVACFYGISAAFAAIGLWLLKAWAAQAFLTWSVCVFAFVLVFGVSYPTQLMLGGVWGVGLFSVLAATLLFALHRYVRGACALPSNNGMQLTA